MAIGLSNDLIKRLDELSADLVDESITNGSTTGIALIAARERLLGLVSEVFDDFAGSDGPGEIAERHKRDRIRR